MAQRLLKAKKRKVTPREQKGDEPKGIVLVGKPSNGAFTAVELFAGAGGLSIGLEHAGINVVIANEIMPDFAATSKAIHLRANVVNGNNHIGVPFAEMINSAA